MLLSLSASVPNPERPNRECANEDQSAAFVVGALCHFSTWPEQCFANV